MSKTASKPQVLRDAATVFESAPARLMADPTDIMDSGEALAKIMFPESDITEAHIEKAQNLISYFGSLAGVLNATAIELSDEGVDIQTFTMFQAVNATLQHVLKAEITQRPLITNMDALAEYLIANMAHHKQERFKVMFMDKHNHLIADQNLSLGTVDYVSITPREVVKRALDLHASAVILAHNHPSGNVNPSEADIEVTKKIVEACKGVDITVHDHCIVGHGGHIASMRSMDLM